ncbi:MAG: SAM-dependent methyltransferase [Bacteroides sp.]|nr:SAM-dependent methyltransferase [Bacteroides sp.]
MGYVFEELIRKFNEENNEEAGEHFTPREVIDLMTHIIFEPLKEELPNIIRIYDPACGSGGILTEAQNFIRDEEGSIRAAADTDIYLYGKEINDETYAICKSDMMIKGNNPEHIRNGSTLSTDEFAGETFDVMLSNPPYGKSWANEVKNIKDGKEVIDPRFSIRLKDLWGVESEADATPRTSDGQLLFLMEMVSKMRPQGSRIASVHNGSSLFTGDAGSGESNIRRHIIENDMLECIVQLPNNIFYNTGITTYIWVLSNRKSAERAGKVQLIDASRLYRKLRKNLGNKNCELAPEHIREILDTYLQLKAVDRTSSDGVASLLFDNSDFGYKKVTIERPKRLCAQFTEERIAELRFDRSLRQPMQWAWETFGEQVYTDPAKYEKQLLDWAERHDLDLTTKQERQLTSPELWERGRRLYTQARQLMEWMGTDTYTDFNLFADTVSRLFKEKGIKLAAAEKNAILHAVSWYDAEAAPVVKGKVKLSGGKLAQLLEHLDCSEEQLPDYGYYPTERAGEYLQYETESDLRDYENVPLKEDIYTYFRREVKPHVSEAWINLDATKIGYEISFNKYFYRHKPLRSLEEVAADIRRLDAESEGLIREILDMQ